MISGVKISESAWQVAVNGIKDNLSEEANTCLLNLTKAGCSGSVLIANGDKILLQKGCGRQRFRECCKGFEIAISAEFYQTASNKLSNARRRSAIFLNSNGLNLRSI